MSENKKNDNKSSETAVWLQLWIANGRLKGANNNKNQKYSPSLLRDENKATQFMRIHTLTAHTKRRRYQDIFIAASKLLNSIFRSPSRFAGTHSTHRHSQSQTVTVILLIVACATIVSIRQMHSLSLSLPLALRSHDDERQTCSRCQTIASTPPWLHNASTTTTTTTTEGTLVQYQTESEHATTVAAASHIKIFNFAQNSVKYEIIRNFNRSFWLVPCVFIAEHSMHRYAPSCAVHSVCTVTSASVSEPKSHSILHFHFICFHPDESIHCFNGNFFISLSFESLF